MKIHSFYTDVLGANLKNVRWSWGAVDPITNRIFLRVWADRIAEWSRTRCGSVGLPKAPVEWFP